VAREEEGEEEGEGSRSKKSENIEEDTLHNLKLS
jgi:hypothetical protein